MEDNSLENIEKLPVEALLDKAGNGKLTLKTSLQVRELAKRIPKCWKILDHYLSPANKDEKLKVEILKFLLSRALPQKLELPEGASQTQLVGIMIKTDSSAKVNASEDGNGNKIISLQV